MDKLLAVGTDCSGIEAPIQALKHLGIPFRHVFSSEIDKYCIQSIKANYEPEILYTQDMRERNHTELPDIDLYVCGFPCQPFSQAGRMKGLQDNRGNVFFSCIDTIRIKQPKYFILENVRGILWNDKKNKKDKYGETWKKIWNEIEKLRELGYHVDWRLINTRDYGIPQNRTRVYIIGTLKGSYEWPKPTQISKPLATYVDKSDTSVHELTKSAKLLLKDVKPNTIFVDLSFRFRQVPSNADEICPCLLTKNNLYCLPMNRFANIKEKLALQGFPEDFKQVISNTQLHKQLGNSMSVNVLVAIIKNLI